MSNEAITWAFRQNITNSSAKFVLVVLADHADESWQCFPSQKKIARMTGLGERSVRRALEWLEEHGFVTRCHRYGGTGRRTSDRYQLNQAAKMTTGQNGRLDNSQVTATGQNDHRSDWPQALPANLTTGQDDRTFPPAQTTTGQSDHRSICPSLPANLAGHEPSENPQIDISLKRDGTRIANGDAGPELTTVPPDFTLSDEMRGWAADHTPGVDPVEQTAAFVDYWLSKGERRANWQAAWRSWMRNRSRWDARAVTIQAGHRSYRNPAEYGDDPNSWT